MGVVTKSKTESKALLLRKMLGLDQKKKKSQLEINYFQEY